MGGVLKGSIDFSGGVAPSVYCSSAAIIGIDDSSTGAFDLVRLVLLNGMVCE